MIKAGILLTPDLTPINFSLSDCIEDHVHATSLLNNLQELKHRICKALESTDTDGLYKSWIRPTISNFLSYCIQK